MIYVYGSGYERYVDDLKEIINISFFFEQEIQTLTSKDKLIIIGMKAYYEYFAVCKKYRDTIEIFPLISVTERMEDEGGEFIEHAHKLEQELYSIIFKERVKEFSVNLVKHGRIEDVYIVVNQVVNKLQYITNLNSFNLTSVVVVESSISTTQHNKILIGYEGKKLVLLTYLNFDPSFKFIFDESFNWIECKEELEKRGVNILALSSKGDEKAFSKTLQIFKQNLEDIKVEVKRDNYFFTFAQDFSNVNTSISQALKIPIFSIFKINELIEKLLSLEKLDKKNGNWRKKLFVHQLINESSQSYVNFDKIKSRKLISEDTWLYKELNKQEAKICKLPVQLYNGLQTITGRMYCLDKTFPLQNLSKGNRDIVTAVNSEYVLVNIDFKSFEYYLWHRLILNKEDKDFNDPHLDVLQFIFRKGYLDVISKNLLRVFRNEIGKLVNFAVLYGQQINSTIDKVIAKLEELEEEHSIESTSSILLPRKTIQNSLYKELVFPSEKFKEKLVQDFLSSHSLINHFKTKLFPKRDNNNVGGLLLNNYLQSTGFDFLNLVLFELFNSDEFDKIHFYLQQHDSLLFSVKKKDYELVVSKIITIINSIDEVLKPKFEIKVLEKNWE